MPGTGICFEPKVRMARPTDWERNTWNNLCVKRARYIMITYYVHAWTCSLCLDQVDMYQFLKSSRRFCTSSFCPPCDRCMPSNSSSVWNSRMALGRPRHKTIMARDAHMCMCSSSQATKLCVACRYQRQ